jgi:uncharacterized damage-inducible protein DinB
MQGWRLDQAVKHWVGLWDYLDGNFWHVWEWSAKHLSPAEVGWQPIPRVASIGWNLQHLGEMLAYYLTHVFNVGGPLPTTPLRTMQSGNQDDGRYRDLQAIAAYHRPVRAAYRQFLESLSGADLDRVIERQGKRTITYAWAVGHIAEHESYHIGKCILLRSLLLEQRATRSRGQPVE